MISLFVPPQPQLICLLGNPSAFLGTKSLVTQECVLFSFLVLKSYERRRIFILVTLTLKNPSSLLLYSSLSSSSSKSMRTTLSMSCLLLTNSVNCFKCFLDSICFKIKSAQTMLFKKIFNLCELLDMLVIRISVKFICLYEAIEIFIELETYI